MSESQFRVAMRHINEILKLVYRLYPPKESSGRSTPTVLDDATTEKRLTGFRAAFLQLRHYLALEHKVTDEPIHERDVTLSMAAWPISLMLRYCAERIRASQGLPPTPVKVDTDASASMRMVRVNAPEWYRDPGFIEWLNSPGTATWHPKGEEPSEGSDVFFTWSHGEAGSDWPGTSISPGIPDSIWEELSALLMQHVFLGRSGEALVWVSNLQEGFDVQPLTKDD